MRSRLQNRLSGFLDIYAFKSPFLTSIFFFSSQAMLAQLLIHWCEHLSKHYGEEICNETVTRIEYLES
jgi:hypothetical protein